MRVNILERQSHAETHKREVTKGALDTASALPQIGVSHLKGARFGSPVSLKDDTNAMGRGTTAEMSSLYTSLRGLSVSCVVDVVRGMARTVSP